MFTTATDELFDLIVRSGLLGAERLTSYRGAISDGIISADKESLLKRLVADSLLTPFQAKHLLSGRYKGFFIGTKYKLLAHLGSGGMGQVYLCEHLMLNRLVAVKVLKQPNKGEPGAAGAMERFFREARAVAALDHPNIARLFDMDRDSSFPYMVMEFVDGSNLHGIVADHGSLSVDRAVDYTLQVARGLDHAHEEGLVHRDIKPGNLLLDRSGVVKLLDLGVARFFADDSKNDNITARFDERNLLGTADFIAPEQTSDSSSVDIRADIYSLGCTLYFFLTGRAPFEEGTLHQKLMWHQVKPPRPVTDFRTDIPTNVVEVLENMMRKDVSERYQTPKQLIRDLEPLRPDRVTTPLAHEMPKMKASAYKLGLVTRVPDPSGTSPSLPALTPLVGPMAVSDANLETPSGSQNFTVGGAIDGFLTAGAISPNGRLDTEPMASPSENSAPRRSEGEGTMRAPLEPVAVMPGSSRLRRWMIFAGSQLFLLACAMAVVWYLGFRYLPPSRTDAIYHEKPITLKSGGSTLVQKAMEGWISAYSQTGMTRLEYEGTGSGKGVEGVLTRKYDFACTDAYATDDELKKAAEAGIELVHIPLVMGAVVPSYNLPDLKSPLNFSGPVLAEIYLGKITKWNDSKIAALNPRVELPDLTIQVIYRSDSSGSTYIWTDFLSKTSSEWVETMKGPKTQYESWPVGQGAAKSSGVAEAIVKTPGAIGYIDLTQAMDQTKLTYGRVKNKAGNFVDPTLESVSKAAPEFKIPTDLRYTVTDPAGEKAYPIAGTTWAIFDAKLEMAQRRPILDFLDWAIRADGGQRIATRLHLARLPEEVVMMSESRIHRLRGQHGVPGKAAPPEKPAD